MEIELYLLWNSQAWGLYDKMSCPDPAAFPDHWYRKYCVSEGLYEKVFRGLMEIKGRLEKDKVSPSKEAYGEIFPGIDDLLK